MMNILKGYCFVLVFCFSSFSKQALANDDDAIPVIEGDGGVIKTAVEDGVLILTQENFDIQVMSKEIILVEFYAPWCGHCKSLEPEYAKAAKLLSKGDSPIPLAKVDATVQTELAARFQVSGYPTLYIFKKGEKIEYDGPRSAMGIVEYIKERADPNWKPPPEAVITLTKDNFNEIVENAEIILVEFYAPWCGHCKRLAPEYERAAKELQDLPSPIPLAKIDGIEEKDLAEKYEARGWPTLMIFRKGRKYAYEGPREETGIVSYMKEQAKPPSTEAKTFTHFKSKAKKSDTLIIGFFDSSEDDFFQNFHEAANTLRGKYRFFHSFDTTMKKHFDSESTVRKSIFLILPEIFSTNYERPNYSLESAEASVEDITSFIHENSVPLVGEKNHKSRWLYEGKYPLVVVYYDVDFSFDHIIQTQLIRNEVAKVANDFKGRVTFVISNENQFEDELKQFNFDDSGEDVNVGFFESAKVRYRMDPVEDFSADQLRPFVENVLSGDIKKHIKSQPKPKAHKGPVKVVVGSTFEELVMKNKKDVLIEFYAPWCGHCKKLEPVYKKLGKAFENSDKVEIMKMDATANDYPSAFEVSGFPTIYYVSANSKAKPFVYNGERTLKELTKFINEQLSSDQLKDEL